MFRESIETIIAECRSQERILSILESEQFWDRFAREVVLTGSPETEVWDAKETLDAWHCPSATRLSKEVQFAERAASFANCDGGALILGISDKPPRKLIGIRDTEHRATNVRDLLERLAGLDPTVARVMPVRIQADGGAPKLCLVVAIAQTSIPIRVDQGNGTWSYPVRRGSDTVASTPEAIHTRKVHGEVGAANFGFLIRLAGRLGAR